jgi:integrase
MRRHEEVPKQRGVYEKTCGSGIYYVRYVDSTGRLRREKAGTKSAAIMLYRKRKQEALEGRKLPEKLRKAPVPTLADFSKRFLDTVRVRCAAKPRTIEFYVQQTRYLLAFDFLANRPLHVIDEATVEEFAQARRQQVGPATTNRGLAVLRRMLRLAQEWRLLDRIPRVRLLRGERNREFVLSREQERIYLEFCPTILHDVAMLMLDTGLGPAEALGLQWPDTQQEYLQVREGKTRYRARSVNLTSRVAAMLESRRQGSPSAFVFAADSKKPLLPSSLAHLHARVRRRLKLPADFVLYSLRHTALTRLGESGADAFTIMRIAGHSSVTTSQRYVHPSSETVALAIARLDTSNQQALGQVADGKRTGTRTDTVIPPPSVSH